MHRIFQSAFELGLLLVLPTAVNGASVPSIRVGTDATKTIDVAGLSAKDLAALAKLELKPEKWSELFAVYVAPARGKERGPALLGSYRIEDGLVRFEPRFPLAPGVHYQAVFELVRVPTRADLKEKRIEKEILLAKEKTTPTEVTEVYPTSDRLPENQLKFYLHFSAPMSRGDSYKHIKLLDEKDKAIDLPFLELDQELWDGTSQRLTVFCDPGRIKRGLKPREEFGPVLEEGKRYTLVIDSGLEDGNGSPLKEAFRKSFRAVAPDDTQPDPKNWKVKSPRAGTRKPLIVTFPKPLDHALLERLLWVTDGRDQKMAGRITFTEHETVWQFTPEKTWEAGTYQIAADTRLEDLAGNSIARPFEVDEFRRVEREVKKETVKVQFKIE